MNVQVRPVDILPAGEADRDCWIALDASYEQFSDVVDRLYRAYPVGRIDPLLYAMQCPEDLYESSVEDGIYDAVVSGRDPGNRDWLRDARGITLLPVNKLTPPTKPGHRKIPLADWERQRVLSVLSLHVVALRHAGERLLTREPGQADLLFKAANKISAFRTQLEKENKS